MVVSDVIKIVVFFKFFSKCLMFENVFLRKTLTFLFCFSCFFLLFSFIHPSVHFISIACSTNPRFSDTKSVIHNDDNHNINCLFSGRKRFAFWSVENRSTIESSECGWINAEVNRGNDGGENLFGYGSYGGQMNVTHMDLEVSLFFFLMLLLVAVDRELK